MTDFLTHMHGYIFDADRIPYAMAAIVITMIVGAISGPLGGNAYPFMCMIIDKIFGVFGDRLDRKGRPQADLAFRGAFVTLLAFGALFVMAGISHAYFLPGFAYGWALGIALLSLLLTSGAVWFVLLRLYFALEKDEMVKGAYYAVARSARVNLNAGDDFAITRIGMDLSVRTLDKGLVAPVIWYLIGGLPAAMIYALITALAWRFGKDGQGSGFGAVPLALERLLGFVPSLFTALLLNAAALFTPTAQTGRSIASWLSMKNRAHYAQGGLPLMVLAGALNVSLGGARQDIGGSAIKSPWVGPEKATAKSSHKHLRRALVLNAIAQLLFLVALACAYLWAYQITPIK